MKIRSRFTPSLLVISKLIIMSNRTILTQCSVFQQTIKKQILKNKLQDDLGVNFAYKECVVHSQLSHDCVVKLHEYTESEDQFVLFMEYANDAEYFDNKIVEVRIAFLFTVLPDSVGFRSKQSRTHSDLGSMKKLISHGFNTTILRLKCCNLCKILSYIFCWFIFELKSFCESAPIHALSGTELMAIMGADFSGRGRISCLN